MEGQIIWAHEFKTGHFIYVIRLENDISVKTYVVKGFKNWAAWKNFKAGDGIGGLDWFDKEKKIISADSPIYPLE